LKDAEDDWLKDGTTQLKELEAKKKEFKVGFTRII